MDESQVYLQVNAESTQAKVLDALVPDFRDSRKKDFLVLRSANYSITEALAAVDATSNEYNNWKNSDPVFNDWAVNHVWDLMHDIGREVLLARFKRCVFLQLGIDTAVLTKKAMMPGELTPDEQIDARAAANRYNATAIATIFKIFDPSIGEDRPAQAPAQVDLTVHVTTGDAEEYDQRRLQAKKLLQSFKQGNGTVIEAEYKMTD